MIRRIEILKRLMALYGVVEERHSVELQRAINGVQEAQQAIGIQQEALLLARSNEREALKTGDRMGWTMAGVLQDAAGLRRRRLDEIRLEREGLSGIAKERYMASRLKSEQMKRVVDRVSEQMEMEYGRRAQAVSDDRFLARRRWTDGQEELHADTEIKTS